MSRLAVPEEVLQKRLVAILRGGESGRVLSVCETLVANGVSCLEVTTQTPGWAKAVAILSGWADIFVGVGTVLRPEQVGRAADAGARFVVSPGTVADVGRAAEQAGLCWFPGALSPTEIATAWEAGATAVKVFPASAVGGAHYIRSVRAPLSYVPLIPTGGIGIGEATDCLDAGAVAVGVGSPLIGDALQGGSLEALAGRARSFSAAVGRG